MLLKNLLLIGLSYTINHIFKDELGSNVNALRNVTVLRGERGSTVQLDDTILFAADTSAIVRTDSSTPSNESPNQKMPAIEQKPEGTSTTTTSTSNETGQEVTDPGTTDPQASANVALIQNSSTTDPQASVNIAPTQSTSITQILSTSAGINPDRLEPHIVEDRPPSRNIGLAFARPVFEFLTLKSVSPVHRLKLSFSF